jgi:hypothetical protein
MTHNDATDETIDTAPMLLKWTICHCPQGRLIKICQYADESRALVHRDSLNAARPTPEFFVKLYPANPERVVECGGRRKSSHYRRVGLPQY